MVAHLSQRVALTRVDIRAPAPAIVSPAGRQRPGWKRAPQSRAPRQRISSLTARHTATSSSLLRDAVRAELRAARYTARHAARKPFRWTAAIAAATAVGAIAASAGAAPWASAASGLAADEHAASDAAHGTAVAGSALASKPASSTSAPDSRVELTSREVTVKPASTSSQAAVRSAVHPALRPKIHAATTKAGTTGHASAAAKPATTAKHATAAERGTAVAKPAASKPAGPTIIYDSVTPSAIPAGKAAALYANGAYQASTAQVAGHGKVLWIDVKGSNPRADVLDVEPGDATPAGAAAWASAKLTKDPGSTAIIYTFKAAWGPVVSKINALPAWMHSRVKYWIADPTGTAHILPGAAATQWYWGAHFDISSAKPDLTS